MTSPEQFQPASLDEQQGVRVEKMQPADVGFYRFLYSSVGEQWRWRDRLLLSEDDLEALLNSSLTSVYVLYVDDIPAGYIELAQSDESIEIAYFGLRPEYMGKGLGKYLLSYGITQAWNHGTKRVWVHTCNLDGHYALDNYIKRGFSIDYIHEQPMPEHYL